MEIERSDYKLTAPDGSTVDEEDPDIDLDHYTSINLPSGDLLIILTNDDKKGGDREFEKLRSAYAAKVKEPAELPSDLFDSRNGKATIVAGKINGMKVCFEFGMISGVQKCFILTLTYEKNHPDAARKILQEVIETFVIKE